MNRKEIKKIPEQIAREVKFAHARYEERKAGDILGIVKSSSGKMKIAVNRDCLHNFGVFDFISFDNGKGDKEVFKIVSVDRKNSVFEIDKEPSFKLREGEKILFNRTEINWSGVKWNKFGSWIA